jgi:hypothetical protein
MQPDTQNTDEAPDKRGLQFPNVRKVKPSAAVYAVMCEGGGLPTVLHDNYNKAAYEAARLAHLNPDHRFHLLKSIRVASVETVAPAQELAA